MKKELKPNRTLSFVFWLLTLGSRRRKIKEVDTFRPFVRVERSTFPDDERAYGYLLEQYFRDDVKINKRVNHEHLNLN